MKEYCFGIAADEKRISGKSTAFNPLPPSTTRNGLIA
jgi:hypothetical protein